MAFLVKEEMKNVIRDYQLDAITDGDDTIVEASIAMAVEEAGNLLASSVYDVVAIFTATGGARNLLMMGYVRSMTMYWLCELANVGTDYRDVLTRYTNAKEALQDLADPDSPTSSATLPRKPVDAPDAKRPFQSGSNRKFNHSY